MEDPGQRQGELIHFVKDVALAGAALAILDSDELFPSCIVLLNLQVERARR